MAPTLAMGMTRFKSAARPPEESAWAKGEMLAAKKMGQYPHGHWLETTLFILKALGKLPASTDKILEVGSGNCNLAMLMAEEYRLRIEATDILDVTTLPHVRRGAIHFTQATAQNLPFADSSFEAAVDSLTLAYTGKAGLKEMHRVLKPGGKLLALMHYENSGLTRWVVRASEIAKILLEMEEVPEGKRKNLAETKLQELMQPKSAHIYEHLELEECAAFFKRLKDKLLKGTSLADEERAILQVYRDIGNDLREAVAMSEEKIRVLFEENGFDVLEVKNLIHTTIGFEARYSLLGIVAKKRGAPDVHGDSEEATLQERRIQREDFIEFWPIPHPEHGFVIPARKGKLDY